MICVNEIIFCCLSDRSGLPDNKSSLRILKLLDVKLKVALASLATNIYPLDLAGEKLLEGLSLFLFLFDFFTTNLVNLIFFISGDFSIDLFGALLFVFPLLSVIKWIPSF